MNDYQRSMTKIEVLLDKINLLHTTLSATDQPDQYDLQLMRRYAQQLAEVIDDELPTESKPAASLHDNTSAPTNEPSGPLFSFDTEEPESSDIPVADQEHSDEVEDQAADPPAFSFVQDEQEQESPAAHSEPPSFVEEEDRQEETDAEREDNDTNAANREEEASLNDIFRGEQKDLADKLKDQPIKSLQQEIDLNQKFWFIQELFDGDNQRFMELLQQLDRLRSYADAEQHIKEEVLSHFDWSAKEKAASRFMQLVQRRYV